LIRLLVFFAIAFSASIAGAISGIGGGIIIKPLLDAVSHLSAGEINFLSGATVLSMSIVSLLRSKGSGVRLEGRRGSALAAGAVAGGLAGKELFNAALDFFSAPALVKAVQSAILLCLTALVFFYMLNKKNVRSKNINSILFCVLTGCLMGVLSAFLGIGGGPINIMVISWAFSMDSKSCALHSLYTIFLSQAASLILTLLSGRMPPVSPPSLAVLVCGGIAGGLAGSAISGFMKNEHVDKFFSVILAAVMLLSVYNFVRFVQAA
jgi:uncharacterized membrane protein YfcA